VDGLELIVQQGAANEQRQPWRLVVQVLLPVIQRVPHLLDRRRDEAGCAGTIVGRVDPVLAAPKLAGRLVLPADPVEQDLVHLLD
jgi:hypothetical protein